MGRGEGRGALAGVKDRERSPNAFASKSVWTSQPFVDTWQWDRAVYVTADWRRSVNHRQSAYGKLPPGCSHARAEDVYKGVYRDGKPPKLFLAVLIIADTREPCRCSYLQLSIGPVIP